MEHAVTSIRPNIHLIPQDEILLVDLLEGEPLPRLLVLDEVDGPVGAVRDQLQLLKVVVGGIFEGGENCFMKHSTCKFCNDLFVGVLGQYNFHCHSGRGVIISHYPMEYSANLHQQTNLEFPIPLFIEVFRLSFKEFPRLVGRYCS